MSVVIETTLGTITVDLYLSHRPRACLNFLKLCKMKYYNYNLFHTISRGFIAQTGDPTGSRAGGESIYGVLDGPEKRYFEAENEPRIKHTKMGLISFVGNEERMIGSQFFITLGDDLIYLDEKHCVFGEVVEGFDVLEEINEVICDTDDRPYQDVRITHTVILDDPLPNPKRLITPSRSPSPSAERLQGGRIAPDEDIDEHEGKSAQEVAEMQAEREAKARATILEMVGDIPDADMAPPENVLFVCKLNPVTSDDDLEVIFNRFGKIKSCEVIRDRKTGDSLQYAFIEFEERKSCEDAYFKMDNILIDDRRIHVDFSQSVSKVRWLGKGRGVKHLDGTGNDDKSIGKGEYKQRNNRYKNTDNNRQSQKHSDYKDKSCDKYYNEYRRPRSPHNRSNDRYSRKNNEYRREKSRSKSPIRNKRYGNYESKSSHRNDSSYSKSQHIKPYGGDKRYFEESDQRKSRRDRSRERYKTYERRERNEVDEKRNTGKDVKKKTNNEKRYSSESESEDESVKHGNGRKISPERKYKPNKKTNRRKTNTSDSDVDSTKKKKKRKSQRSSSSSSTSESDHDDRRSKRKKNKKPDSSKHRKKSHKNKKYSCSDSD